MAVALLLEFPGATQEQFGQVAEKVGSKSPPGLLYHVDGPIEGGWRVVDVWESQEAVDTFFQEHAWACIAKGRTSDTATTVLACPKDYQALTFVLNPWPSTGQAN